MSEIDRSLKFYDQPVFINLLLLIINMSFFILKLIFSILTESLALQADSFDSMTDIVMCLTALIGLLFANKKPNEKFPFGYYKMENIISLIISLFIFITAFYISVQSLLNIINFVNGAPKVIFFSPIVFFFLIVSLLSSILLALYLKSVGQRNNSPIIESEAKEKLFDVFISLSVLIGFIGVFLNFYILDSFVGLIIAIYVIKGGYDIFLSSTKTLLDAVIDFDNRKELHDLIEKTPKIKRVENMEIRAYGMYVFLELEISLSKNFPLSQIDVLKNKLKVEIKERFPIIFKIIIIIRSQEKKILKIAIPLENDLGLNSKIATHFGESLFFGFLEFQDGNHVNSKIIENQFSHEIKRKGILVSDWLISKKIDMIYLKKDLAKGPSLIFNNNFIEVKISDLENLNDIITRESV